MSGFFTLAHRSLLPGKPETAAQDGTNFSRPHCDVALPAHRFPDRVTPDAGDREPSLKKVQLLSTGVLELS